MNISPRSILGAGLVMQPVLHVVMTHHVTYHAMRTASPVVVLVPMIASLVIQGLIVLWMIQVTLMIPLAASVMMIDMVNHLTVAMYAMMHHVNTVWDLILMIVLYVQITTNSSILKMKMPTSVNTATIMTSNSLFVVLVTSPDYAWPNLSQLISMLPIAMHAHVRLENFFMMEDVLGVQQDVQSVYNLMFTAVPNVSHVSRVM